MEVLGGQKIKSPGSVMNCPENQKKVKPRWGLGGVEVLGNQLIQYKTRPGMFLVEAVRTAVDRGK